MHVSLHSLKCNLTLSHLVLILIFTADWHPESDAYKANMAERERLIMSIPGSDERWENWMQFTQARLVPTFTERGFEKVRVPAALQAKMAKAVQEGVDHWDELRSESAVNAIYQRPGLPPKMVNLQVF